MSHHRQETGRKNNACPCAKDTLFDNRQSVLTTCDNRNDRRPEVGKDLADFLSREKSNHVPLPKRTHGLARSGFP
jgi:hypothetical protein